MAFYMIHNVIRQTRELICKGDETQATVQRRPLDGYTYIHPSLAKIQTSTFLPIITLFPQTPRLAINDLNPIKTIILHILSGSSSNSPWLRFWPPSSPAPARVSNPARLGRRECPGSRSPRSRTRLAGRI